MIKTPVEPIAMKDAGAGRKDEHYSMEIEKWSWGRHGGMAVSEVAL